MATRALDKKCLKTQFPPDPVVQIENDFTELVPHDALYQNFTNGSDLLNKGAVRALDKKCL